MVKLDPSLTEGIVDEWKLECSDSEEESSKDPRLSVAVEVLVNLSEGRVVVVCLAEANILKVSRVSPDETSKAETSLEPAAATKTRGEPV